ncbi:methylated-DNA--[protein]-cysteine S-methyltransferase [Oceanispirochaeta sp.]|jgi:methylated-DNA-[protein]-cysteine S-methyltransferase|uniref:methylated-DNA--[protein]-cysteine S-methyltransferase n=1 Tax=Oceanispirochaeta sp. TaxID=2035350 RepID=UPI002601DAC1|nr:methylated-DNA--[protein]-cysteine S-methyltransferase [Oceanispirochaeta sp.]MDA3958507.1 methylated-DNA--[protein]-cysteine S-methyltransferase [Oceanispirochaeta sp.]
MEKKRIQVKKFKTPVGDLLIGSLENKICLCDWQYRKMRQSIDQRIQSGLNGEYEDGNSDVIEETMKQLEEYFSKNRQIFDIPLLQIGSEFQKRVWAELLKIPYGETSTYKKQSESLGNSRAIRAVASANGANAISIIIPCHRIIGSKGDLVGYAGGLGAKEKLLALESEGILQLKLFSDDK